MLKDRYVLEAEVSNFYPYSDGYYTGKSYIHQGERFAIVSKNINEAKIYFSKIRAIQGCKSEFSNYTFKVIKVEE